MNTPSPLKLGTSSISKNPVEIAAAMANRHGVITGATGTGKTRTMQLLIEEFARHGTTVIAPDIKGDLSGLAAPGVLTESLQERLHRLGMTEYEPHSLPVQWWCYEKNGVGAPLRTTLVELGPLLLGRILGLNDTQGGALEVLFRLADEEGLLLVDTEDLHALLTWASDLPEDIRAKVGSLATTTLATIRRKLEAAAHELFLGEPALNLEDLFVVATHGNATIHLIDARDAMVNSRAYALTMTWLLSELFESLPEVGDLATPKLAIFIDEAHLLFDDAPQALLDRIEQVVRLIRSKGVSLFFVSQNVTDIPQPILNQMGTRVHHAVRAFTPADRRGVKAITESVVANPAINIAEEIVALGIGEALVSTLDLQGRPTMIDRVLIAPPSSSMAPLSAEQVSQLVRNSPLVAKYATSINPQSAAELLQARLKGTEPTTPADKNESGSSLYEMVGATVGSAIKAAFTSFLRSTASQIGREITRGILGGAKKGRR